MERKAFIRRKTNETDVSLKIDIDGIGNSKIDTGIGFFDHMLLLFAKHGFFDLEVETKGDLEVDGHHTVEDTGIVLGRAIKKALGKKESIKRYGTSYVPMDESLALVVLDISERPFLVFDIPPVSEKIGDMDTQLIEEFFRAVAFNGGITLHIKGLYGKNSHHIIEGIFKAFGKALDEATQFDERIQGVMSTKGLL
jgi:imidazoleglycerol-phosphate dehydratase